MIKTTGEMTTEEKQQLFYFIAPAELHDSLGEYNPGRGRSGYIDGRWIGGIVFHGDTNILSGGVVEDIRDTGVWIDLWMDVISWSLTVHPQIVMTITEKPIADLMMKMGAVAMVKTMYCYEVYFKRDETLALLESKDWTA